MIFLGELSALTAATCWSGSSFVFSTVAERLGAIQLNISRMLIASILLLLTILITRIGYQLSLHQVIYLILSGVVGLAFGDSFLYNAYQHIGARISMLIMAVSPIISAVLAFFFLNENLSYLGVLGIVVTVIGVGSVVLERSETSASKYKISKIGIFYGLIGALGQAGGLIFAKVAFNNGEINGFVATFIRIISAVSFLLPLAILAGKFKNPIRLFIIDKKAFTSTLIGTILGPYLGITFSLVAIENAKVGIAATLMSTMPIIMLPIAGYVYKEYLSRRAIAGAFLAVGGVAILFLK